MLASRFFTSIIHFIEGIINFNDFVIIAILLFSFLTLFYFYFLTWRMSKSIRGVTNEMGKLEGAINEKIVKLDEVMKQSKNKVIMSKWKQYYDTLLEYGDDGIEIDFETFFNKTTLVDVPLQRKIADIVPGAVTATGILGTFAGLVVGLDTFDLSTTDTILQSMGPLLEGLKVGFLSSVTAIIASIAWQFVDKISLHKIANNVNRFQAMYEVKFPSDSFNGYMVEMIKIQNAQAASMEQMQSNFNGASEETEEKESFDPSTFFSSLEEIFKNSIGSMSDKIEKVMDMVAETNQSASNSNGSSSSMIGGSEKGDDFWDKLEYTLTSYFQVTTENNTQIISLIRDVVTELKEELTSRGDNAKRLAEVIDKLEENTLNLSEKIEGFLGTAVNMAVDSAQKTFSNDLQQFEGELQEGIEKAIDASSTKLIEEIGGKIDGVNNDLKEVGEDVSHIKTRTDKMADRMEQKDSLSRYRKSDDD